MHTIFQLATEPKTVQQATERVSRILDASYEKDNLVEVVKNIVVTYLRTDVKKFLNYYYNLRIYLHEDTLKKELERLCKIGVLYKCSNSVLATPTFIFPKKNARSDLLKISGT